MSSKMEQKKTDLTRFPLHYLVNLQEILCNKGFFKCVCLKCSPQVPRITNSSHNLILISKSMVCLSGEIKLRIGNFFKIEIISWRDFVFAFIEWGSYPTSFGECCSMKFFLLFDFLNVYLAVQRRHWFYKNNQNRRKT